MTAGNSEDGGIVYTIGTLVTDWAQYRAMRQSFAIGGFGATDCEFITIDNSGAVGGDTQTSAYAGLNRVLGTARGRHVILCHQDVRLLDDDRATLDQRLSDLDRRDPAWAVAGNAGGVGVGRLALRISDPHGPNRRVGELPTRVESVDENFIVVKRAARVGFSRDLDGFHLYGADLCLVADVLGYTSYVIDFHLQHLSPGNRRSQAFRDAHRAFEAKWSRAFRPRFLQTTCALVGLSGGMIGRVMSPLIALPMAKIARRLPSARGWTRRAA